MAITYPTAKDVLTNPLSSDPLNNPSHSTQHGNINDAVEALETKVGIDSSADTDSIDYKLKSTSSSNPGHKHTLANGATDITASAAELNLLDGISAIDSDLSSVSASHDTLPTAKATKDYVDGIDTTPAGVISMYAGASAPEDWLLCDGSAVSRTTYAALFTAISTAYGVGDSSTTFNLPDLRGNLPVGYKSTDTSFDALGETGGAKTATIAQANLPNISTGAGTAHTHTQNAHTHTQNAHGHRARYDNICASGTAVDGGMSTGTQWKAANTWIENSTATNQNTTATNQNESAHTHSLGGSGTALAIMNPYVVVNYIIKT